VSERKKKKCYEKGPEIVFGKHLVRRGDEKIIFRGHLSKKGGENMLSLNA
jgi:hypothetical protein